MLKWQTKRVSKLSNSNIELRLSFVDLNVVPLHIHLTPFNQNHRQCFDYNRYIEILFVVHDFEIAYNYYNNLVFCLLRLRIHCYSLSANIWFIRMAQGQCPILLFNETPNLVQCLGDNNRQQNSYNFFYSPKPYRIKILDNIVMVS